MIRYKGVAARIAIALVIGGVAGCQHMSMQPADAVPTIDVSHPHAKLVLGSQTLLGKIAIGNPRFRAAGDLTEAQVQVQNLTEMRYTLEYKYDWTDSGWFSIDTMNTWHRFTLTPRESKTFRSTGKTPKATNIVFTVRLPDDAFIESYKHEKSK